MIKFVNKHTFVMLLLKNFKLSQFEMMMMMMMMMVQQNL